jgi:hypothetical protein
MKIRDFGPNIWIADGPPVAALGPIALPTRMTVVKLSDDSLWINSPVTASRSEMERIALIGAVKHLVSPTPLHNWRLGPWKKVFPDAALWPRDSLGDDVPPQWAADLDQVIFEGNLFLTEVEFFHAASRSLIVGDFVQNYPKREHRPLLNAVTRVAGVQGGGVPLDIRLSVFHRSRARATLGKLLSWDFDRLIVAHGDCIESDAKAFVQRAFRWLIQ